MYLKLYRFFSVAALPFIYLWLLRRRFIGKEDKARFGERLGMASLLRRDGQLVWIHAASVGEAVSVLPLIQKILDKFQSINILVTTGTVTSAKLLESRLPNRSFHQYVPIDSLIVVKKFLKHWKPDIAIFVESELWPNLIIETHKTGCRILQVNARISQESCDKWGKYGGMINAVLSCFGISLAQSEEDAQRLKTLGAPNVKYIGNLKFDAPPLPADPKETGKLMGMIGFRPVWLAASTHPGEEQIVSETHKKLKEKHEELLTIIIPRHPERGGEIAKIISPMKSALRSEWQSIEDDTDFYIADTIGELGIFYRLVGIVFMGGSLVPHGGQNPLEAARLECALLTGSHTENFKKIYGELAEKKAVINIGNAAELASKIDELISDNNLQKEYATNALAFIESKSGVVDSYLKEIENFIKK